MLWNGIPRDVIHKLSVVSFASTRILLAINGPEARQLQRISTRTKDHQASHQENDR